MSKTEYWNTEEYFADSTSEQLIERVRSGADPNARREGGKTPLHRIAVLSDTSLLSTMIELGSDPNGRADDGLTPLHVAAEIGEANAVEQLLRAGGDPSVAANDGDVPLLRAASGGYVDVIEHLLHAGADPNASDNSGFTPLHEVASAGNPGAVDKLLHAGADPNKSREDGVTALHSAANAGAHHVVGLLIESGGDVNAVATIDGTAVTPLAAVLYAAPSSGDEAGDDVHFADYILCALQLLAHGANANDDTVSDPLLTIAVQRRRFDLTEALLDSGANPNRRDDNGFSSLYYAWTGELATALVESGADVNALNENDETPLHIVAANASEDDALAVLLERGADLNKRDHLGHTPYYYARENPGLSSSIVARVKPHYWRLLVPPYDLSPPHRKAWLAIALLSVPILWFFAFPVWIIVRYWFKAPRCPECRRWFALMYLGEVDDETKERYLDNLGRLAKKGRGFDSLKDETMELYSCRYCRKVTNRFKFASSSLRGSSS